MTTPTNVYEVLALAKLEFKPLKKSGKNPHFGNEYSTHDDIKQSTEEALRKHDLQIIHSVQYIDSDSSMLTTMLWHTISGTHLSSKFYLANEPPQKMGSAITYARRYNVVALLDLIADVDDDGESYYGRGGKNSDTSATTRTRRKGLGGRLA